MSFRSRLERLERELPPAPEDDPDAEVKETFRAFLCLVTDVLEDAHPEALRQVYKNVQGNWCAWESSAKPDIKWWLMRDTVWAALREFPEAERALEEAVSELEQEAEDEGDGLPVGES